MSDKLVEALGWLHNFYHGQGGHKPGVDTCLTCKLVADLAAAKASEEKP